MRQSLFLKTWLTSAVVFLSAITFGQSDLILTAVFDGPLSGGTPKGVEIYVINDIPDLSLYGLGSANNGGGTDGEEFTFPAVAATAGDFIYVASEEPQFLAWFGFAPNYTDGSMGINGDDAIELFQNGTVVDLFGDTLVDGTGQAWEYLDSWAYRSNGSSPTATFSTADWSIPGPNVLDGETTNTGAAQGVPIGTFDPEGGSTITAYTIQEIQETMDPSGDSPLLGEIVETSGVVTAVGNGGFWIQDGTGAWSGIFVLDGSSIAAIGDNVTVQGAVQESFDFTRISSSSTAINSSGNTIPSATAVSTADANDEQYESVLLSISGALCVNADAGFGEYILNDGSGDYRADDLLFAFTPTLFAEYDAVGIGYYSFGNFKLAPRDVDDIEDTGNNQLVVGFESDADDVQENAGSITINVQIVNPNINATSVDVTVTGGTAVNGVDYTFTDPTNLTFPAGSGDSQSFSITINDNFVQNEDKTIELGLTNATNGALLIPNTLLVTILDNEVTITDIATVSEVDVDGLAVNDGLDFNIQGVVLGGNLSSTNTQFTLVDGTGGMAIFQFGTVSDYVVTEGDELIVTGEVDQFNGLTQLEPTSIVLVSQGNELPQPTIVTTLGENTESELVAFQCATLVDPAQWTNSGSGFNVDVTNGTETITLRIDNEVDLYNQPAPEGEFDVVGIGGQFDNSSPFTEGYQLLPRSSADILTSTCAGTPAFVSALTLPCGGEILQVTGAFEGSTAGGDATAETRTIYAYTPDNAGGVPTYLGTAWPYVIVSDGFTADAGISANLTVGANDILLVDGWPAYQFVGDVTDQDATGNFGPWFYFETDGALSQDPCPAPCEDPYPAVDPGSLGSSIEGNTLTIFWDPIPGSLGCQVQGRPVGGPVQLNETLISPEVSSFSTGIGGIPAGDYEWRVRCGCSFTVGGPFSAWQPVTIGGAPAINSYPNPTEGISFVSFSVPVAGTATLEVYDMTGRLVDALFTGVAQPNSDYRFQFDGSNLPNGIYLYRLTTESGIITNKFMVSK